MKELIETLVQWRSLPPTRVSLGRIKVEPQYQPRNNFVIPYADREKAENASEAHIARLTDLAEDADLDPLLLADVDGRLVLVDGHHRLKAYRRAGKRDAPACVLKTTGESALMVSKLVNCDGVKLPMHAEQSRECAWQYLAQVTAQGRLELPEGTSRRQIGRTFGTSRETIGSMLRILPTVNRADFQQEACDPGTGWPLWRFVKGNAWRDQYNDVSEDAREMHKTEELAKRLATLIGTNGVLRFCRAVALIEHEQRDAAMEATKGLQEFAENADDTY